MDQARKTLLVNIACVLAVMALAVLVRFPSALLLGLSPDEQAAYTTEQGVPYLIDMDSYYHVRIVDNDLDHGSMGTSFREDGTSWDTQSFYPEGRSAEYQPGIVWVTEATWGVARTLFGASLHQVEYCLAALMAALAALVAFLLGYRTSGRVGGIVAGVLVSCAPGFVLRTAFGRYDTDMFVVLMDILLVFLLTEALRARTARGRVLFSLGFGVAVLAYALSWAPQYAMLFAGVFLLGGLLFVLALFFAPKPSSDERGRLARFVASPELRVFGLCLGFTVLAILALRGPEFFAGLVSTLVWTSAPTASGVLPNMFVSVSELVVPSLVPATLLQWFVGYTPGTQLTVLTGVGGVVPAVLSIAALAWLAVRGIRPAAEGVAWPLSRRQSILYFLVLGLFWVAGLYAIGRGVRFIEHLCVPVGVLAGAFAGWLALGIKAESWKSGFVAPAFTIILCVAVMAPALVGSAQLCASLRPSTSDASAAGMAWVKENAADPKAVVVAWWDDGYFYESESGHPCLWDGGSMNGIRSILVGKALTTDDPGLSRQIVHMLAHSGNRSVDFLMERVDAQEAFETIWAALPLEKEQAIRVLMERCNLTEAEAAEVEELLHPAAANEAYLVLTNSTLRKTPWIEYFANWDFTGNMPLPTDANSAAAKADRTGELMYRLHARGETLDGFTSVFEENDGLERMRIWRVEGVD